MARRLINRKIQNVSEIIIYNFNQQKRFFADVTLKSSIAHYRLMKIGYFATFSSSKRHPNSYLVAQNVSGYCNFFLNFRLMKVGYFATFSSSKRHPNSYLVAQNVSIIAILLGTNGHLLKKLMTSHSRFERC